MAFRIWQSHLLAADLATKRVSQRDSLKYMLLAAALYVQAIYFALWVGTYRDWGFAFELAMVLVISLLGVNECYKANGGDDGEDFLFRFAALAVPVGFNLAVLSLLLGQAIYWGAPFVLGHGTFRDPQMVYRLVSFIMPLAFTFVYYWRIAHHLATVRARQLAFNTENAV